MTIQEAIKTMMQMSIVEAGASVITRPPDSHSSKIKLGFDPLNGYNTGNCMVVYDADEPARFMKDHCAWVSLRLDEILADDWIITDDKD